jgi:hypothetical protein
MVPKINLLEVWSILQRTNTENSKQKFPAKELRGLSTNFPHSCVCKRFIYSHDRSAYSAAGNMRKYAEYINRSHIHECVNWD